MDRLAGVEAKLDKALDMSESLGNIYRRSLIKEGEQLAKRSAEAETLLARLEKEMVEGRPADMIHIHKLKDEMANLEAKAADYYQRRRKMLSDEN